MQNNPLRYTDPSGHCIWDLCIVETMGVIELGVLVSGLYVAIMADDATNTAPYNFSQLNSPFFS